MKTASLTSRAASVALMIETNRARRDAYLIAGDFERADLTTLVIDSLRDDLKKLDYAAARERSAAYCLPLADALDQVVQIRRDFASE